MNNSEYLRSSDSEESAANIVAEFEDSDHSAGLDMIEAHYEHGQWWIMATNSEDETVTFSVVDAYNPLKGGDYLDFEQV